MTEQGTPTRRFGERERVRLTKLFAQLGTFNDHEFEAARSAIDGLLRSFCEPWGNVIKLLGGTPGFIQAGIASDIAALGSDDPKARAEARIRLNELLASNRVSWNDLLGELISTTPAAWVRRNSSDDPERVNPLALVHHLLGEYVAFRSPHERVAVALWTMHTHAFRTFTVTPRLALRSPVPGCGKTVCLDMLSRWTARPAKYVAITTAALYHLIDERHPTLLIDEADNFGLGLSANGKLKAIFNSGHRNGDDKVTHWDMSRGTLRDFTTFCPLALALPNFTGGLPPALDSRCITINMQRHSGQPELKRLDVNHPDPALDVAYTQILLWQRDLKAAPLNPNPKMPEGLGINRIADNWRPLLSIADALGWGAQARAAMVHFAAEYRDADPRIPLLSDIRQVFNVAGVDRLFSVDLLAKLHALDSADWAEFCGVRGDRQPHKLKVGELAAMLGDFWIRPRSIWPLDRTAESKSAKGYMKSQFTEAWGRYCSEAGTPAQPSNVRRLR